VLPKNPVNFNVDNVRVAKILGMGVSDSEVVKGFVLTRGAEGNSGDFFYYYIIFYFILIYFVSVLFLLILVPQVYFFSRFALLSLDLLFISLQERSNT
jgi:hypothetical protein